MKGWRSSWLPVLSAVPRGLLLAWSAMLALGVLLRVHGLGHSFWYDEALWAPRLMTKPLLSLGIRPVGFMALARLVASTFGATEFWLRLVPMLSGVLALLLMCYVARQLLATPLARYLLVLLFAIHPALIDLGKEFKPYSFEVLVHLAALALYLRFRETEDRRYLYGLVLYLPLSFLCAYNMAFAVPGLLLLCLWHATRAPDGRRLLVASLLSGASCLAAVAVIWQLSLRGEVKDDREVYWGSKYNVFYHPEKAEEDSRVDWMVSRYNDLLGLIGKGSGELHEPGFLPEAPSHELGALARLLCVLLGYAGLARAWRTRRELLLLLALPVVGMACANLLGKWPFGAFRTNVFAAVYVFPLPLLGFEWLAEGRTHARRALIAAVLALLVAPGLALAADRYEHRRSWTRDHMMRQIIEKLYASRLAHLKADPSAPPEPLLMDPHTAVPFDYYMGTHPEFSRRYGDFFAKNFVRDDRAAKRAQCSRVEKRLAAGSAPIWVVLSSPATFEAFSECARKKLNVLVEERLRDQHLIFYLSKRTPKR